MEIKNQMTQTNGKDKKPLGEGGQDKRKEEGIRTKDDLDRVTITIAKGKDS